MELLYIFLLHGGYENVYFFRLGGWIVDEEMTVCVYYRSVSRLLRIDGTVVHLLIFTTVNYPSNDCTVCIFMS